MLNVQKNMAPCQKTMVFVQSHVNTMVHFQTHGTMSQKHYNINTMVHFLVP